MSKTIYTAEMRPGTTASVCKKNIITLIIESVIGFICLFIPAFGWIISIACFILAFVSLISLIISAKMVSSMVLSITETGIRTQVASQDVEIAFHQVTRIYVQDEKLFVETTLPEKPGSDKKKIIQNPYLADPKGFLKAFEAQKDKAADSAL